MKRIIFAVAVFIMTALVVTGCTSSGGDKYEYNGFIIEIYENARGETAVVTLWGDVQSTFVINKNTRMIAPAEVPLSVGDCIMLNTTRTSDEYVKDCKIYPAHSTEGRIVCVEGDDAHFLLTKTSDGTPLLVRLIDNDQNLHPGISGMGDVIKVYHFSEILQTEPTAHVEGLIYVENGTADDITAEDIAFIESLGYTLKTE